MKKVLLVTIQDNNNFGNRLQNYALQTIIERLGFQVDNLILNDQVKISFGKKLKYFIEVFLCTLGVKKYNKAILVFNRRKKNAKFTKQWIHNPLYVDRDRISSINWHKYEFAVTGSDQVWHNFKFFNSELEYFYLMFIEANKRISYAPSFGFTSFPEKDINLHIEGLSTMHSLSCREIEGCRLINELVGRKAEKVLDPTLLLQSEDWVNIEENVDWIKDKKYLLLFFLGPISQEYHEEINSICQERNLEAISINSVDNIMMASISAGQFLYLIEHADFVCTDSYHAIVFSIIFNKNLRVFNRISNKSMFGRVKDLLDSLGLNHLIYDHNCNRNYCTDLNKEGRLYLETERKLSIEYLRKSLQV